ncbi:MAG TPA: 30S ribosome-binding factor RbfA [Cytophagales bacterium]|nr:30S ribosome-binding factor RbfA [Cytophagales bacterium]
MDSKRQQKIGRLLQKEISSILISDTKSLFDGAFITVTQVKVTSDLSIARIYLSLLMTSNKEALLEKIKQNTKTLRQLLSARIKNQMRVIPDLQFFIDDTAEYAEKMNNIIAGLNIPPESKEEEKED